MKPYVKIALLTFILAGFIATIQSCKKKATIPSLTTASVSGITQTSALSGGNVTSDGGAQVTSKGVCWDISHNPTTSLNLTNDGTGVGAFISNITNLTPNTTYYVRAYAINGEGIAYGNEASFSTSTVILATLTTTEVSSITPSSGISGGNITDDGGGNITARGVCWSTNQNPTTADNLTTDGSGDGSFTSNITGLSANTTYYVVAYATNSAGTAYGNQVSFATAAGLSPIIFNPGLTYGTVTDIEGTVYKTIQIGSQVWMAENLKTTTYNDNTAIPNVTSSDTWDTLVTPAYCWFLNDAPTYKPVYGALYNWYAANTGKLCPSGWHVPSLADFNALESSLGDPTYAGGKMKETGTTHWLTPNGYATNESGFTGLPGGFRDTGTAGFENNPGVFGEWWSSTFDDQANSYYLSLIYVDGSFSNSSTVKGHGLSVRCIKD